MYVGMFVYVSMCECVSAEVLCSLLGISLLLDRYNCAKPDVKEVTLVVYCQRGKEEAEGCRSA